MSINVSIEDGRLLSVLSAGLPLVERPFAAIGESLGMAENEVVGRIAALKEAGVVGHLGAVFDSRGLGYRSSLVAFRVAPGREDEAAEVIGRHPGVTHVYGRPHAFNVWATLAVAPTSALGLDRTAEALGRDAQAEATRLLPALALYKVGVKLDQPDRGEPGEPPAPEAIGLIRELQKDLPLVPSPYAEVGGRLGIGEDQVLASARQMVEAGRLRRVAAVVQGRPGGLRASAMGVFAVPEERIDEVADAVSNSAAVSHCYRRPVYPDWPYALFTMVQGRTAEECEATLEALSKAAAAPEYAALPTTKAYKRARLEYFSPEAEAWEAAVLERARASGEA
ncbi:MAG TPA: Lrp/AsnC family transcriptional regulator [Thermodesulfobacteriota bacterium]